MPDPLGDISYTWYYIFVFIIGYLIGSIPFGLIFTKLSGYGDITKIGSGNIGATNVLRTGNKKIAFLTLILDICKGLIPTIIVLNTFNQDLAIMIGTGSIIGHIFPLWLINFQKEKLKQNINIILISILSINVILFGKGIVSILGIIILLLNLFSGWGGKAVATSLGVIFAINPIIGLFCTLTWSLIFILTKYSSLSALISFLTAPLIAWVLYNKSINMIFDIDKQTFEFYLFLCIIIWIKHIENIKRLINGKEPKIGQN